MVQTTPDVQDVTVHAYPLRPGHRPRSNRRSLIQGSLEDTITMIGTMLSAACNKHHPPELLSYGGDRAVFGWSDNPNTVVKVSLEPELTSEQHPWEFERSLEYQQKLRCYFPKEWLLPEHHHQLILSQQNGKTWKLITDFQKRLSIVYYNHTQAPSWCYRCPERGDHKNEYSTEDGDSYPPDAVTVRNIATEVMHCADEKNDDRDRYIRVTQQLLQKEHASTFNEREFLSVQRSPYLRDVFRRMDTDDVFREKSTDFIDATTIFCAETDEIVDGMGRGNILFREDAAWDPLFVDVEPPKPPRMLLLARSILQSYSKIGDKKDPERWRKLRVPLVILANTMSNIRTLNACRRKLGMNPKNDIALCDGSIAHLGQIYDDLSSALRTN